MDLNQIERGDIIHYYRTDGFAQKHPHQSRVTGFNYSGLQIDGVYVEESPEIVWAHQIIPAEDLHIWGF